MAADRATAMANTAPLVAAGEPGCSASPETLFGSLAHGRS